MKWEHMTVVCEASEVSAAVAVAKTKLDELAGEGWEMVGVTSDRPAPEKTAVVLFLKRAMGELSVKRLLLSRVDFPGMFERGGLTAGGTKLHALTSFGLLSAEFADQGSDAAVGLDAIENGIEGAIAKDEEFKTMALKRDLVPLKDVSVTTTGGVKLKFNGLWLDPEQVIGFVFGRAIES